VDTAPIDSPGISTRLLGVIRVLVPALAGALACASILIGFLHRPAAWPNAGPIGDGGKAARVRGWFTSDGFYRPELEAGSGRQFSWTSGSAALRIDHIDRSVPWRVEIRARAGRAPGIALPDVTISVDDVAGRPTRVTNDPTPLVADLPTFGRDSARISIHVSDVFTPGPRDRRALGVVVEQVALMPANGESSGGPGTAALWSAAAVGGAAGLAIALCGPPIWITIVAAILAGGAFGWLLAFDLAAFGTYINRLTLLSIGLVAGGAAVAVVARMRRQVAAPWGWTTAAGLLLAGTAIKLAVAFHPQMMVGDGIFHVHRAQLVEAGRYFFTSTTPAPYFEFPYAIGLYVAAMPFWSWLPADLDRLALLRVISATADLAVGLVVWGVARRFWHDDRAGVFAAAFYSFIRIGTQTLGGANLTNLFAQGVFGVGLTWLILRSDREQRAVMVIVGGLLLAAGFLSHFSTASVGGPLAVAVAIAMRAGNSRVVKQSAIWMLLAVALAAGTSWVTYYSRFMPVYRQTLSRVGSGEGSGQARSMVRPASEKASASLRILRENFGVPLLALSAAGAVLIARKRARDPLTLALAAWLVVTGGFAVLGVVTPIEMRANLAAEPLVAILGASTLSAIATRFGLAGRIIAIVLLLAVILDGLVPYARCLGI